MGKVDYAALKKGGFMRQKQKNCFSLRVKVVGGNLTSQNIKTIAEVSEKYGEGYVHLTSRQSLEIPFIKADDVDEVLADLEKGDVKRGVCGPRVRTITACQGSEICPSGCIDTTALAKELDERYFGRELPHKFKFGVTGCVNNCLKAEENDVGVKGGLYVQWKKDACINCGLCVKVCRSKAIAIDDNGELTIDRSKCNYCGRCYKTCPTDAWDVESVYVVSFGGLFGNQIIKGEEIIPPIKSKDKLFEITDAAIDFFAENANPSERFRLTIQRIGEDKFKEKIKEAYENGN